MDDAVLFHKIVTAHGGKPGIASKKLRAFLRPKSLADEAVEYISRYTLKKSAYVGPIDFYSEAGWLGANAEGYVPLCLRDGLLIVGSCPNGDPVVVDVRDRIGASGYVGHETMWDVGSIREVFVVLAPSPGKLAQGLDEDRMPLDYYEARDRFLPPQPQELPLAMRGDGGASDVA